MVVPNLQNPVLITVSRIDKNETIWDEITRENLNIIKRRPNFNIDAQIVYRRVSAKGSLDGSDHIGQMNVGMGGIVENSDGYVIVRVTDLALKSLSINDVIAGDKIIKLGQIDVEYFILGKRPAAHYKDQGGFTLLLLFFEDRNP